MVAVLLRLFTLLALLGLLTVNVFAIPIKLPPMSDDEISLLNRAEEIQIVPYNSVGHTWDRADINHIEPIPHFERLAWEHTNTQGALYVGTREYRSVPFGFRKQKKYFFTVIDPNDPLGQEIRLGRDRVMTVLWKQDVASGKRKMVYVGGVLKKPNVPQLQLKPLDQVLQED